MKLFLCLIVVSISTLSFSGEFERGYREGLKACTADSYYICHAKGFSNPKLKIRSLKRGHAIKELYDYCYSPSRSVHRYECETITEDNQVSCLKL